MKKVLKNYKSTIVFLGAVVIGAICGLIFKEKAEIVKPQVPKFELPKIMDLPKKTEEVLPKEEPKAEDDIIFK